MSAERKKCRHGYNDCVRCGHGSYATGEAPAREAVNHPAHYGGADNPYETLKVIEAWGLGFCLGNTVKYIARADQKGAPLEDLKKGLWYLQREIDRREREGRR